MSIYLFLLILVKDLSVNPKATINSFLYLVSIYLPLSIPQKFVSNKNYQLQKDSEKLNTTTLSLER